MCNNIHTIGWMCRFTSLEFVCVDPFSWFSYKTVNTARANKTARRR